MGVRRSGNNSIDALLKGKYWNDTGRAASLTYSIDSAGSNRLDWNERKMVREALTRWSQVANIIFREVSKGGNLRFAGEDGTGGVASYKEARTWWKPRSWGSDKLDHVDIKLGRASATGRGNRFLEVALHEIGHAMGLKHPGNYNGETKLGQSPFLSYSQDNNTNTVMSYNDVGSYAATPMAYDIRAVQYLYGAKTFNSGNTHYKFDTVHGYTNGYYGYQGSKSKRMKLSLWDSGGSDTLDFSKLAASGSGYYLNINGGGILTHKTSKDNPLEGKYTPRNNGLDFSVPARETSLYGTTIAYGTVIENVIGSNSNDYIIGNNVANRINGQGGDDRIDGRAGDDRLYGWSGNDHLFGREGNDYIRGDSGNDRLYGWSGNDRLYGGSGNDLMYGDDGSDYMRGDSGDDIMWGESSRADLNRRFRGGNDDMAGGSGNDEIHGGKGDDRLYGDSGNDRLYGDSGNDYMRGGTGNDFLSGSFGNDRLYGGDGEDRLYGGDGNDFLGGWDGNDYMIGGFGKDRMYGDDGNDYMSGGFGDDVMWGESSEAVLNALFKGGDDVIFGGYGDDEIHGGKGNDQLNGGWGKDTLIGDEGNDALSGDAGDDILLGGGGADKFIFHSVQHGLDRIIDFASLQGDKIQIKADGFGGDLVQGLLQAGQFVLGSIAADASDRFIYNRSTGALSFDIDGAGGASAIQFAKFSGNIALSHSDFSLV